MTNVAQYSLRQGSEFLLAQDTVNILESFFPGWEWSAMVDGGILYLKNTSISENWAIQLKADHVSRRGIMEAGGEFLERFGMPAKYDQAAVETADRDFTGAIISEKWTKDRRYWNKSEQRWKA